MEPFHVKTNLPKVDRALRRAMFQCHGCAAPLCHRAAERSIHLAPQ